MWSEMTSWTAKNVLSPAASRGLVLICLITIKTKERGCNSPSPLLLRWVLSVIVWKYACHRNDRSSNCSQKHFRKSHRVWPQLAYLLRLLIAKFAARRVISLPKMLRRQKKESFLLLLTLLARLTLSLTLLARILKAIHFKEGFTRCEIQVGKTKTLIVLTRFSARLDQNSSILYD